MRLHESEWHSLFVAGLREEQIRQLVRIKHEVATQQRSEFTLNYYRRAFAKYLYEAGRLSG
jgi:hypothetical protein